MPTGVDLTGILLAKKDMSDMQHKVVAVVLAVAVSVFGLTQAQATPRRHHKTNAIRFVPKKHHRNHHRRVIDAIGNRAGVIGGRPAGCPTQFCGCGLARYLGLNDRSLWLAREWFRFPRTSPHSGAVAVRSHHVFLLEQHVAGNVWQVLDYNSGSHLTRVHTRSIAGYTIVEPSRRFAEL